MLPTGQFWCWLQHPVGAVHFSALERNKVRRPRARRCQEAVVGGSCQCENPTRGRGGGLGIGDVVHHALIVRVKKL